MSGVHRFLTAVATVAAGCASASAGGDPPRTAAEMEARIDAAIPAGTAAMTAEERLVTLGFAVSRRADADWDGRQHVDYVYGYRSDGIVVQTRWHVALFEAGGVVTGSDVKSGLVGL